jgi:hypothetical protein
MHSQRAIVVHLPSGNYHVLLNHDGLVILSDGNYVVVMYYVVRWFMQFICIEAWDANVQRVSDVMSLQMDTNYIPLRPFKISGIMPLHHELVRARLVLTQLGSDHVYNKLLCLPSRLLSVMYKTIVT